MNSAMIGSSLKLVDHCTHDTQRNGFLLWSRYGVYRVWNCFRIHKTPDQIIQNPISHSPTVFNRIGIFGRKFYILLASTQRISTQNYSVKLYVQRYDDNPLLSHPTPNPDHPISE